jgi:hypothetical protein
VEIQERILIKYYEQATIEQLMFDYRQNGYEVFPNHQIDKFCFDLVAKKDDETIVFELKAGEWISDKRLAIQQLRNFALHKMGAKFKLVLVNLPKEPELEIEDIESKFPDVLADHFINEFYRMATHFQVDDVSDINFTEVHVRKSELEIKGSGIVSVNFQYGSDSDYKEDNGLRWSDSFDFVFHLLLNKDLDIKEIYELEIDIPQDPE